MSAGRRTATTGPTPPSAVGEGTRGAARAVAALASAEVVGKVATFVVMVAAARVLGQEGFGAFSLALSIGLLLAAAVAWGYDTVLTRDGARDREALVRGYADLVALRLLLGGAVLLGTAVVLAGLGRLSGAAGLTVLLLTASALLDTLADAGRSAAAAVHRQVGVAGVLVVQRALTAVVALGALLSGGGLLGVGLAFLAGSLVSVAAMHLAVTRLGVPLRLRQADRRRWRALSREALPIGVNSVVSTALFRLDAVLLGLLVGTAAVGEYSAAYRLLETVLFVTWTIARAVFPLMASATQTWRVRRGVERGTTVCAFVFVPYALLLLLRGDDLLRLLFGDEFAGSGDVLAALAPAPALFAVCYLCAYGLYAVDRSTAVLGLTSATLVLNTALNLVLIPPLGAFGAALATSAAYAVESLLFLVVLRRHVGRVRLLHAARVPLLAAVPAALVLLLLPLPVLVAALLEGVVYLATWVVLSRRVDPEGLAVLRSLVPGGRA